MDWSQILGPDFQDWLTQMSQIGSGLQLDDQTMNNMALAQAMLGMYQQFQGFQNQTEQGQLQHEQNQLGFAQNDYQMANLQYLHDQLGLNEAQLQEAYKELEYQSGPYHDYLVAKTQNDLTMSNNDVLKAGEYLKQQQYATEAAQYQRDVARYQAMQTLGLARPDGLSGADPMFASYNARNQAGLGGGNRALAHPLGGY